MIIKPKNKIDFMTRRLTRWVGTPSSLVLHTIFFVVMLALIFWGYDTANILLVLTTVVSLEAIYLAIFIQYSVNQQASKITEVVEDIGEVTEDVSEISKDVEEISEEIDEMHAEAEKENLSDTETYDRIEKRIALLLKEIKALKKEKGALSAKRSGLRLKATKNLKKEKVAPAPAKKKGLSFKFIKSKLTPKKSK